MIKYTGVEYRLFGQAWRHADDVSAGGGKVECLYERPDRCIRNHHNVILPGFCFVVRSDLGTIISRNGQTLRIAVDVADDRSAHGEGQSGSIEADHLRVAA